VKPEVIIKEKQKTDRFQIIQEKELACGRVSKYVEGSCH
jgi:hypothetical protein